MIDLKVKNWSKSMEEFDLVGKTERFLESVWTARRLIVIILVIGVGVYLYAGYLSALGGQPEIKSVAFDHQIDFTYLGADTGKYASNLQLNEGAMDKDGWYGQIVIRASDPDLIVWKYSLVKDGQVIDLKKREYNPPTYYKLFNYDEKEARYQKGDFKDTNTFFGYFLFAFIAFFLIATDHI
jgi:hypothetical protein